MRTNQVGNIGIALMLLGFILLGSSYFIGLSGVSNCPSNLACVTIDTSPHYSGGFVILASDQFTFVASGQLGNAFTINPGNYYVLFPSVLNSPNLPVSWQAGQTYVISPSVTLPTISNSQTSTSSASSTISTSSSQIMTSSTQTTINRDNFTVVHHYTGDSVALLGLLFLGSGGFLTFGRKR
ncbi:MAG: hypothetical protein KGJ90_06370 [Patescibacteria group bacterium]|nr:hypothetical protein [Patescibacteria group bacterium]